MLMNRRPLRPVTNPEIRPAPAIGEKIRQLRASPAASREPHSSSIMLQTSYGTTTTTRNKRKNKENSDSKEQHKRLGIESKEQWQANTQKIKQSIRSKHACFISHGCTMWVWFKGLCYWLYVSQFFRTFKRP